MQVSTIFTIELPVENAKTRQNLSQITWIGYSKYKKVEMNFFSFWIFKNSNFYNVNHWDYSPCGSYKTTRIIRFIWEDFIRNIILANPLLK